MSTAVCNLLSALRKYRTRSEVQHLLSTELMQICAFNVQIARYIIVV